MNRHMQRQHHQQNNSINPPTNTQLIHNNFEGDIMQSPKDSNITRTYHINHNGFQLNTKGGTYAEFLEEMKRIEADIICISEPNLDTTKHKVREILYQTQQNILQHSASVHSSSAIPTSNFYKPGGASIITQDHSVGRITDKFSDEMGRWSSQTFTGKFGKLFTVISVYRVCETQILTEDTKRSKTAAAQQLAMMKLKGIQNVTPRVQFSKDFTAYLKKLLHNKHEILAMGDYNEEPSTRNTGITKLIQDCFPLVDLMYHKHRFEGLSTYMRGHNRIDFALATPGVLNATTKCGYEPFHHRITSDHRAFFIDLDTHLLFGNETYHLAKPNQRDFQCSDKSAVEKYLINKDKYFCDHKLYNKLDSLETQFTSSKAESIDCDVIRGSLSASKKLKRKPSCPHSTKLAQLRKKKNLLLSIISQTKSGYDFKSIILHRSANLDYSLPPTLTECKTVLRQTAKAIKEVEKNAATHRLNEQEASRTKKLAAGDKKGAEILRKQIKGEQIKAMYRKIGSANKPSRQGLTSVDVPKDETEDPTLATEFITIDLPEEVETKLRERNQKHMGKAKGSPPTVPPFSEAVNWEANTHEAELILEGEYTNDELDEYLQLLVSHMKRKSEALSIQSPLTREQFESKLKTWKESTSTSPSNFNLSHWKALLVKSTHPTDSEDYRIYEERRLRLLDFHWRYLNCLIINQHSLIRWQVIVNVMIQKEVNNNKIHRLRVLHLYEAEYNLLLGVKWRELTQALIQQKTLNPALFGGLPGVDAQYPTFIEEQQYEICRTSRRPLVHKDWDLDSCYDRMIPSITSLASRAYGLSKQVVCVNATTLKQAKYLLKTQLGISEQSYSHSELIPIYGTGQGSGNSPVLWVLISSTLFDIYESLCKGSIFISPDGTESVQIFMIGFVDDTSSSTNMFAQDTPPSVSDLIAQSTEEANHWNRIVHSSGAALDLNFKQTKCSYHVIYYDFTIDGSPVLRGGTFGPYIQITKVDGTTENMKQISAYTAHRTLGCHKEPAGNHKAAIRAATLNNKRKTLAVMNSPFNKLDTWTHFTSVYMPSMSFPLPSSLATTQQLNKLQSTFMQAALPRCGFARTSPKCVIHGPSYLLGGGFKTLNTEHGAQMIQFILKALRTHTMTTKFTRIAIAWNQHQLGTGTSFLTDTTTALPHWNSKYYARLRKYLQSTNATIILENYPIASLQREHDTFLMDHALSSATYTSKALKHINACRLFLNVTLVSDISSLDGLQIQDTFYRGRSLSPDNRTTDLHCYQDDPSPRAWESWRTFLISLNDTTFPDFLQQPLGNWIVPPSLMRRQYKCFTNTNKTWLKTSTGLELFHRYADRSYFKDPGDTCPIPNNAYPTSWTRDNNILHTESTSSSIVPLSTPTATTFQEHIYSCPQYVIELLRLLLLSHSTETISSTMTTQECILVTDGSASPAGSFGWTLETTTGTHLAKCSGYAYGMKMNSYRAEGYGLLSGYTFLKLLQQYTKTTIKLVHFYTDSQSMVNKLDELNQYSVIFANVTLKPEWDVIQAIMKIQKSMSTNTTLAYVKGHQDKTTQVAELSQAARMNVEADALAEAVHNALSPHPTVVPMITGTGAHLTINGSTYTSNIRNILHDLSHESQLIERILKINEWSRIEYDYVDWEVHRRLINKNLPTRNFHVKFVHELLPLGARVHKYSPTYPPGCPSCGEEETVDHFLRCSEPSRLQWRIRLLTTIRSLQLTTPSHPILLEILQDGLDLWFQQKLLSSTKYGPSYHRLISEQNSIGWKNILYGRFSQQWATIYDNWIKLEIFTNKPSGTTWTTKVANMIYQNLHELWLLRNSERHGKNKQDQILRKKEQVLREIKALYDYRNEVAYADKDIFYPTYDEHATQVDHLDQLQQWTTTWGPIIRRSALRANLAARQGMRTITNLFRNQQEKELSSDSDI